jgi:hypothetical protein
MTWNERRISRQLKLRDLHVLMTVARCGSMGKAANQLSVSQPAISKAIADMEAALGVRLLDRNPRGVVPTIYARALLDRGLVAFQVAGAEALPFSPRGYLEFTKADGERFAIVTSHGPTGAKGADSRPSK